MMTMTDQMAAKRFEGGIRRVLSILIDSGDGHRILERMLAGRSRIRYTQDLAARPDSTSRWTILELERLL